MLDDKRIREAEKSVKSYIEDQLLWKNKFFKKEILETYNRNYEESINLAQKVFEQDLSNLWVVVISYYSMYYISNAVLYKIGYKVGSKVSHKVTSDALIVLIRNKLKKSLLEDYEEAKEEALEIIGRKTNEIIGSFDKEMERVWKVRKSVFKNLATKGFIYIEDASLPTENLAELIIWLEKRGIPSFAAWQIAFCSA